MLTSVFHTAYTQMDNTNTHRGVGYTINKKASTKKKMRKKYNKKQNHRTKT